MFAKQMAGPTALERVLVIERTFAAPRELVFQAWINPDQPKRWWGPKDYPVTQMDMDVRPGGTWRGCLRAVADGRELWHRGVFREIAPPERLVFTFAWEEEGERGLETLVTVTFATQGGRTLMTLRQEPFQSVAERDGHRGGWNSAFDRLEGHLPSRSAPRSS